MSLRRRLTLSLVTILVLFAINVGTHFWGSVARNESMEAYRNSVDAARLSTEVEQLLNDQRQTILVLSTIRENTGDMLGQDEYLQAQGQIGDIRDRIRQLGRLSRDVTRLHYERLLESSDTLLRQWSAFYDNYNDADYRGDADDTLPYLETSQRLKELEQHQSFIAVQRANIIDRTIALTDRITVIGFIASIVLTATLGFILVRYTNRSLKKLKRGTERLGGGDLSYRIENIDDSGELGDLAKAFNAMSEKLRNAMYDVSQARDAADEANAAKSIFLANVSHELRTPLNAIIGYSEMLHDELSDPHEVDREQFQQDLEKIIRSGRQLLALINDILDLSKIETGKMSLHCEDFQPGELLAEACDAITPQLRERGNQLETADFSDLPTLFNDATKFRQVFTNLLSNACKFTENGTISVAAREPAGRPGWVEVSVTDTGIGMTAEQQSRVFDAFVQADTSTSANYGGTGLGLAICRDFCELMGGNIRVESAPGAGTTFTVRLPSDPESTRAAA
ncbi:HAMP domain-containing histidine kinase [Mangrovimicrobium sediminis]|uniref:histidine kinase n=1 Tax=Mangrovimicrobium sediminis TaxID=2562682 RepID=A0A4Z0M3G4_9GAMM|nr:HAMP domain-containing sensor histidine kinase [Haliea sp. SAOS-164]TGD73990.1 HAMP domain-containing histidine kinase [Haliea sp. SAOS-164]